MPQNGNSAWDELEKPAHPSEETIRRADSGHGLDFFRGKDFLGRHMFMFRVPGPVAQVPPVPNTADIDATFEQLEPNTCQLRLVLQNQDHADIFGCLCANLIEATRGIVKEKAREAVPVVLSRLARWQGMLRPGNSELLSENVQIGLYGELLFLRDVAAPRFPLEEAVRSWRGPYGDEQDFSLGNALVEVKAQRDTADRKLGISSLDQLDTVSGPVFICHQTLGSSDDPSLGRSLRQLVAEIVAATWADGAVATDTFLAALHETGYADRDEYMSPYRSLGTRTTYRVTDTFPRVVPGMVDSGVLTAQYTVAISAVEPFAITEAEIWEH
jgi:hypothetical protein